MTSHDAVLGNVDEFGSSMVESDLKTHSQTCYSVTLADKELCEGRDGFFNQLDFQSHTLQRVV